MLNAVRQRYPHLLAAPRRPAAAPVAPSRQGGDRLCLSRVPVGGSADVHAPIVRELYRALLGREPDPAGLAHFTARLAAGEPREAIVQAILGSYEYRHRQTVLGLYRGLLGREPDAAGYATWMNELETGKPLYAIVNSFVASAEYRAAGNLGAGMLSDAMFVRSLYCGVLGREPDAGGLAAHLGAMRQGWLGRAELRAMFLSCPEFTDTLPKPPADPLAGMTEAELRALGRNDRKRFLEVLKPAAEAAERKYGVPATITLAQAAHETGWGASIIDGFNLFGIKGRGPAGSIHLPTQEYLNGQWVTVNAAFARYHSFEEAVMEHGALFHNGYYNKAMAQYAQDHDPLAFAYNITGIYATDPGYGRKLEAIMRAYGLV